MGHQSHKHSNAFFGNREQPLTSSCTENVGALGSNAFFVNREQPLTSSCTENVGAQSVLKEEGKAMRQEPCCDLTSDNSEVQ